MKVTILRSVVSTALAAGLLLLLALPASAQNRSIKGKVTDDKGQVVADAKITIDGTDVYRHFDLKSNKKGEFFQLLGNQAGTYRVVARKDGFQPAFEQNVRPELGQEVEVNLQLKPGKDYKLPFEMTEADRAEYQKRLEENKKRQQFSKEVKAHFDKGVELYNAGQYQEALASFNLALEKDPKQAGILARTGDCYLQLKKNEEALAAYNKSIELDPNDASVYAQKGVVLSRMGKAEESEDMFKKSAELDPAGAADNFYKLGVTLYNAGDMDKAADAFKKSIAADQNYAESYYLLGMSLLSNEAAFPDAASAFKKYIEIGKKADQIQMAKDLLPTLGGS